MKKVISKKEIKNTLELANDLINIFTDYAFGLDKFFEKEENKKDHNYLYNEYLILNKNIKDTFVKKGLVK